MGETRDIPPHLRVRGERHGSAKLCEAKVNDIRVKHRNGVTQRQLALEYGVTQGTISRIIRGELWNHV